MSSLPQHIQEMPLAGIVPAVMLLIVGVVLWIAGRHVLRGAFIVIGLLIGALIGLILNHTWQTGMPPWVLPTLFAVGLAVFVALTYRLAAAVMLALALGLACPLAVIAVNQWQVAHGRGVSSAGDDQIVVEDSISTWLQEHDDAEARERARIALENAKTDVTSRIDEVATQYGLEEETAAGMARARSIGQAVADAIRSQWSSTPKRLRPIVSLSAIVGALAGLIIGLVARRLGDCAVTAMVGSAIWLSAANVIVVRTGAPGQQWLPTSLAGWLAIWIAIAIIGLCVQWTRKPAPADKPA